MIFPLLVFAAVVVVGILAGWAASRVADDVTRPRQQMGNRHEPEQVEGQRFRPNADSNYAYYCWVRGENPDWMTEDDANRYEARWKRENATGILQNTVNAVKREAVRRQQ